MIGEYTNTVIAYPFLFSIDLGLIIPEGSLWTASGMYITGLIYNPRTSFTRIRVI